MQKDQALVSLSEAARILERRKKTVCCDMQRLGITWVQKSSSGYYLSRKDFLILQRRSEEEKIAINCGWVSLSKASLVLQRAKMTLIDASRRLGIEWVKKHYAQRTYLSQADFLLLQGWCEAHPPKRPSRPRKDRAEEDDNKEFWILSRPEMERRIAAASRWKRRCYGMIEVTEAHIQAELARM